MKKDNQTAIDDSALEPDNPWPGLLTFREADEKFFRGRKKESENLFRLAMRARLTVLFGVSGLGKSSLLHAGLFPKLRRENVLPVYLRLDFSAAGSTLTDQAHAAIAAAAEAAQIEPPKRLPDDTLWEYFHRRDADFWNSRNRIVVPLLVIDQFEELFTLGRSSPERIKASDAIIDELIDLVEGRPPTRLKQHLDEHPDEVAAFDFTNHRYKLIFSLREDFLPEMEAIRQRTGSVALNRLRLDRMTGVSAMEVVNQPHLIQPDVAERVVRSVAASEDDSQPLSELQVEPALLSVVCRELNAKRQQNGQALITMELVQANEKQIVSDLYERSMAGLAPEVRIFVEEQLLTASGYRDSVALENALGQPGITRKALDQLVDGRLVRLEERGAVDRLELTHDLLTGVIVASRDERRRREAEERVAQARRDAEERERQVRRKLRRAQAIGAAFLILALLAVGSAIIALDQRKAAIAAEQVAQQALAKTHIASAVRLVNSGRSDQALAYLGRALRADPANLAARSWISDLLLRKTWVLPSSPVLRHNDQVTSATFNGTGERIVTASYDQTARIWNAVTGADTRVKQNDVIWSVALSPDEKRFATASQDGTARLWDTETGDPVGDVMTHAGPIYSIAFSQDQQWLVTASMDKTARLWDAGNGKPVFSPLEHDEQVNMAVFGAGGQVLTASSDGTARVWNASSPSTLVEVLRHSAVVTSVAFSADGKWAAAASDDGTAQVWDTSTWETLTQPLQNPAPEPVPLTSVSFSPDGLRLATASEDGNARVWDLSTGTQIGTPMQHNEAVYSAVFDSSGRRIVTASRDGTARLWDAWTGTPVGEPLRHDATVSAAAFSSNGQQVVTASWDGTARAWNAIAAAATGEAYVHERSVNEAAFSTDGLRLLTAPDDNAAHLWDAISTEPVAELRHDGKITSAGFSADGRRIVTTSRDDTAKLWDAGTGAAIGKAMTHENTVVSAAFSPDGSRIVTTSTDDTARLWDATTGNPLGDVMTQEGNVNAAAFSPNGLKVVTASQDGKARIWDASTGAPLGLALSHEEPVVQVTFSPDGQKVVTGTQAGVARIWDAETAAPLGAALRHEARVSDVRFSPDGRQVLTASWDGTARLWDAATGAPVGTPLRHDNRVNSARFSPDGKRIATASRDQTARVWNAQTGDPVGQPLGHDSTVNSASFSADGRRLVTASRSGVARVWDVLLGSEDDAELLAELAENVGGYEISALGTMSRLPDQKQRLNKLADNAVNARGDTTTAASLIGWIFGNVNSRQISPLSRIKVGDYISKARENDERLCELQREFPDHPSLADLPPCR